MAITLEYNVSKSIFVEYEISIESIDELIYNDIEREDFFNDICIYVNLREVSKKELNHWKKELLEEALIIVNERIKEDEIMKSESIKNYLNILKEK